MIFLSILLIDPHIIDIQSFYRLFFRLNFFSKTFRNSRKAFEKKGAEAPLSQNVYLSNEQSATQIDLDIVNLCSHFQRAVSKIAENNIRTTQLTVRLLSI